MDKRKSISHHTCECACKAKKQDCIQTVPIFQSLTAEQMGKVHSLIHRKQFFHGEMIYRPGKRADSFYVLKSGKLRVYRLLESGKEQLVRMVNQNEFTGELALFKKGVYEAFAQPQSDCSYLCN